MRSSHNDVKSVVSDGARVRVFGSVHAAIPNGNNSALFFDSEDYDTDGMHDPFAGAANNQLVARTPGMYIVEVGIGLSALSAGRIIVTIRTNGNARAASEMPAGVGGISFGVVTPMKIGDYADVGVNNVSGASITPFPGNISTWLSMHRLGPL